MRRRHHKTLEALVGSAVVAALLFPSSVGATPADDKKAEAARLQDQLDAQGERLSVAAERFNKAQLAAERVDLELTKARNDVAVSDGRLGVVRSRMAATAVLAYIHGGANATLNGLVRATDSEVVVRRQYLRMAVADQQQAIGDLRAARQDLGQLQSRLAAEQQSAREAAGQASTARQAAADAEASQRALLGRANGELAQLVAAEQARREAVVAPAVVPATTSTSPLPATADVLPPTSLQASAPAPAAPAPTALPVAKGAAAAVAEAERQIGKPYVWAAAGPDSFDCSGLTLWAWRAGGVSLSHSAYDQWFQTTRVAVADLRPGDLLFFGPDVEGIHHNGIYVGDGRMIEASQTGTPVRYASALRRDLVGAGRPG